MLLFEGSFGTLLHTGDCRLTIECLNQLPRQFISGSGRALDCVYLDCTFGNVTMVMPSIEEAIEQVHYHRLFLLIKFGILVLHVLILK